MSPSILHLNTYGLSGGAGKAALRLHLALRQLGCNSRIAVQHRHSAALHVDRILPDAATAKRIPRVLRRWWLQRQFQSHGLHQAHHKWESFSDCRSQFYQSDWAALTAPYDIVHLHWLAGFVDHPSFFPSLASGKKLVWTIHDMAPFTGGCHYASDCEHFTKACGSCPQIGSIAPDDWTHRNWQLRQKSLASLQDDQLVIVSPSHWLAGEAKKSTLLKRFEVITISNGIDPQVFKPTDKAVARDILGLPADDFTIFFVAELLGSPRKGGTGLVQALSKVKHRPLTLLTVGQHGNLGPLPEGVHHCHLDSIQNDHLLSLIYSAADYCVVPSLQDNLPNVILESMSSGTPVIGSRVGGIEELVEASGSGILFAPGSCSEIAAAIDKAAADPARSRSQSLIARQYALEAFGDSARATDYLHVYRKLLTKGA